MRSQTKTFHPMLVRAKQHGVRMIASDIDWTIRDPEDSRFDVAAVQNLCRKITKRGIDTLLLTGRDASFRRDFVLGLRTTIFAGCANGGSLYEVSSKRIHTIYQYGFSDQEIDAYIAIIAKCIAKRNLHREDFQLQGVKVFTGFLSSSWRGILPKRFLDKVQRYRGLMFCEPTKVSFVLPKITDVKDQLIAAVCEDLPGHVALKTDQEYGHITRKVTDDLRPIDKFLALECVRKLHHLKKSQVVVFGGALDEIDRMILTKYPYTFTNQKGFRPKNLTKPPFKLTGKSTPVALVHEAISYLICDTNCSRL